MTHQFQSSPPYIPQAMAVEHPSSSSMTSQHSLDYSLHNAAKTGDLLTEALDYRPLLDPHLRNNPEFMFRLYGFAAITPKLLDEKLKLKNHDFTTQDIVQAMSARYQNEKEEFKNWKVNKTEEEIKDITSTLSGGASQFKLGKMKVETKDPNQFEEYEEEWKKLNEMRFALYQAALEILGINFILPKNYMKFPKILDSEYEKGEQIPHLDGGEALLELLYNRLSITFSLRKQKSTALPIFTDARSKDLLARELVDRRKHSKLLNRDYFHSVDLEAGSLLIFRQHLFHFGVANLNSAQSRLVFFDILSDSKSQYQDDAQYRPWQWMAEAFGEGSIEWLNCLIHYSKDDPLSYFVNDMAKEQFEQVSKSIKEVLKLLKTSIK